MYDGRGWCQSLSVASSIRMRLSRIKLMDDKLGRNKLSMGSERHVLHASMDRLLLANEVVIWQDVDENASNFVLVKAAAVGEAGAENYNRFFQNIC